MKKIIVILLSLFFTASTAFTQGPVEVLEKRTEKNKVYHLSGNLYRWTGYTGPVHYKDDMGQWQNVNPVFSDTGTDYEMNEIKAKIKVRKDAKFDNFIQMQLRNGASYYVTPKSILVNGQEFLIKYNASQDFKELIKSSDNTTIHRLANGYEYQTTYNEVGVVTWWVANVSPPGGVTTLSLSEQIYLSEGVACSNQLIGNAYVPDENNRFVFLDEEEEIAFWINSPVAKDGAETIYQDINHSLEIVNGDLIYTKTPTPETIAALLAAPLPIAIDASTYYSETSDGRIQGVDSSSWANARTTGDAVTTTQTGVLTGIAAVWTGSAYNCNRCWFAFDTSGIDTNAYFVSAYFALYGYSSTSGDVALYEGTDESPMSLATGDFNDFNSTLLGDVFDGWALGEYNVMNFNDSGLAIIDPDGETQIAARNYTYDVLNSAPSGYDQVGFYFADETGTDYDPKLVIEYIETTIASINSTTYPDDVQSISEVDRINIKSIMGVE